LLGPQNLMPEQMLMACRNTPLALSPRLCQCPAFERLTVIQIDLYIGQAEAHSESGRPDTFDEGVGRQKYYAHGCQAYTNLVGSHAQKLSAILRRHGSMENQGYCPNRKCNGEKRNNRIDNDSVQEPYWYDGGGKQDCNQAEIHTSAVMEDFHLLSLPATLRFRQDQLCSSWLAAGRHSCIPCSRADAQRPFPQLWRAGLLGQYIAPQRLWSCDRERQNMACELPKENRLAHAHGPSGVKNRTIALRPRCS